MNYFAATDQAPRTTDDWDMATVNAKQGTELEVHIPVSDGLTLAATLYLPASEAPQPCLVEALPYRKDDATALDQETYRRLRDLHGFAVCRIDVRGTGSSPGVATDEYSQQEHSDLCDAIDWLSRQDWCDGAVGMWGMSYSGFNALQVAALRPPALKAVCAVYATDDRWTDDVHWRGGAIKTLDLVDYGNYMTAMNLLPPVPAVWGPDWRDEWMRRLDHGVPWVLSWVEHIQDGPYWRHGSIRDLGSGGWGRIGCPVMLVSGWADGYRNNTFRSIESMKGAGIPYRAILGPWSHEDPSTARPGPRIDLEREVVAWWNTWLREDGTGHEDRVDLFVRRSTLPAMDLDQVRGYWADDAEQVLGGVLPERLTLHGQSSLSVRADVGTSAWTDCSFEVPWGQPTDQSVDNTLSLTWDWPVVDAAHAIVGHPKLFATISVARGDTGLMSAKLCDVFPDGTSVLICRGTLDLAQEAPLVPGQPVEVEILLDACAYQPEVGHRLRLAVAGSDWPNTAAPPSPFDLEILGGSLELPLVVAEPKDGSPFRPGADAHIVDRTGLVCQVTDDKWDSRTTFDVKYEARRPTPYDGHFTEVHSGRVSVDRKTFEQTVIADCAYRVQWPDVTVSVDSHMKVEIGADRYTITIQVNAEEDDTCVSLRCWTAEYPRYRWRTIEQHLEGTWRVVSRPQ